MNPQSVTPAWPFELSPLNAVACLALSAAEDGLDITDPLIATLSEQAAYKARADFRELKGAVAQAHLLRYSIPASDGQIAAADDQITAVLFRFLTGKPACTACVVRSQTLDEVRAADDCPVGWHRQNVLRVAS